MVKKLLTYLSILILSEVVLGNEVSPDTLQLVDLVVTAPLKMNPDLIPLDVTTITASEIDHSEAASILPVLVSKVPGLFVSERGFTAAGVSNGSAGEVNIRGIGQGNKVLFMIDGQPQWAGVFGHSLADTYVANGIEKVEVVKGPSSFLYGSNAMGGSVNIITRTQSTEGLTGRARALLGSFNTQNFALSSGYKKGRFSATLSGQLDRSNGNRPRSSFWLANEFIQMKYAISDHWSVAGMVDMTQSLANNPGTTQTPLENMWTDIFRGSAGLYVKNTYKKADGGVQGFINWGRHNLDDGNRIGTEPNTYLFHSKDYNMGFTLYESLYPWRSNVISAGLDFFHWGGEIWNTDKEKPEKRSSEEKHHVNEVAAYVMMQQGFFHDILNLNAGIRIQHGSSYGNEWIPQAGIILNPGHTAQIKLSFGKGFRAPNIRELYLYPPKNPDLKPEYMLNYEISYRQHFFNYRLMLGAAIYYIEAKNMIDKIMVDGRMRNMNSGKFHNKGFEIESALRILKDLHLSASWAYLHTTAAEIMRLYSPKNKLNTDITYTPGNFRLTLEEMSIWDMHNGNPQKTGVNYTLLNFRGAYTFSGNIPVTLSIKIDNITNRHYEIMYGCPMAGTTIMGGVEFKF